MFKWFHDFYLEFNTDIWNSERTTKDFKIHRGFWVLVWYVWFPKVDQM